MAQVFRLKIIRIALPFVFVGLLGSYCSYKIAREAADELVKPILHELYNSKVAFRLITLEDHVVSPSWFFYYDAKEQMITAPLSIQVSVMGKVIKTEPKHLTEWVSKNNKAK